MRIKKTTSVRHEYKIEISREDILDLVKEKAHFELRTYSTKVYVGDEEVEIDCDAPIFVEFEVEES